MRGITRYVNSRWILMPYLVFPSPYFLFNMQPFRGYQLESVAFKLYSLQAEQLGLKIFTDKLTVITY